MRVTQPTAQSSLEGITFAQRELCCIPPLRVAVLCGEQQLPITRCRVLVFGLGQEMRADITFNIHEAVSGQMRQHRGGMEVGSV